MAEKIPIPEKKEVSLQSVDPLTLPETCLLPGAVCSLVLTRHELLLMFMIGRCIPLISSA